MWQDCLLSLTYDRASCIADYRSDHMTPKTELSYDDAMFEMSAIGLDLLKFRAMHASRMNDQNLRSLVRYQERIHEVCQRTAPHLRDRARIQNVRQQIEYHNLRMHKSYYLSEIGRPTLKLKLTSCPSPSRGYDGLVSVLQSTCVESLKDTVDAFLVLQNILNFACHSWAAVHRALSSALLLAIIGRQHECLDVARMLQELVRVMSKSISGVDPSVLATPITRAVGYLRRLIPGEISHDTGSPLVAPTCFVTSMAPRVEMLVPTMDYFGTQVVVSGPEGSQNSYSVVESILYGGKA
jgi:hypothetical protein